MSMGKLEDLEVAGVFLYSKQMKQIIIERLEINLIRWCLDNLVR